MLDLLIFIGGLVMILSAFGTLFAALVWSSGADPFVRVIVMFCVGFPCAWVIANTFISVGKYHAGQ